IDFFFEETTQVRKLGFPHEFATVYVRGNDKIIDTALQRCLYEKKQMESRQCELKVILHGVDARQEYVSSRLTSEFNKLVTLTHENSVTEHLVTTMKALRLIETLCSHYNLNVLQKQLRRAKEYG